MDDVGETPKEFLEETNPDNTGVLEPAEEGQNLIVDLVDDQEEDEPRVDERTERRKARRSLLDEVDDLSILRKRSSLPERQKLKRWRIVAWPRKGRGKEKQLRPSQSGQGKLPPSRRLRSHFPY